MTRWKTRKPRTGKSRRNSAEIASLVDGLTKIKKIDLVTTEATQAENLRKLLLAMSKDVGF
jgi:(p)ppGpp synthase/HD superfamily hydrolase